jgi:hypothetical protein
MWDLWWTKWHWDRFFSEYFGFLLSTSSFHWCSIKMKKQKKNFIIFITGLQNKPSRLRCAIGKHTLGSTILPESLS